MQFYLWGNSVLGCCGCGCKAQPDHDHGRDEDGEAEEKSRQPGLLGDTAQPINRLLVLVTLHAHVAQVQRVHLRVLQIGSGGVVNGSDIGLNIIGGSVI